MSKSTTRSRLSVEFPLIREYKIADVQDYTDKTTGENISVCKYVKRSKVGDTWQDVLAKEFIENPLKYDLVGKVLKITTEIV